MSDRQDWQAAAEERMADLEHAVEDRLHKVAEELPDPEAAHARADELSEQADRHRERARRLRRSSSADDGQ